MKHLRVINSNMYLKESDVHYYGSSFPHLFPCGCGSPNCVRQVNVSVEEGLKHLLMLHNRKFGQDDVFTLSSFDRIARKTCCTSLYIKMKRDTTMPTNVMNVTKEQMVTLLAHNLHVKKSLKCGYNIPSIPSNLINAQKVLKSIESVTGSSYGTEEEKLKMKSIVHGYTQV